jgi:hypothetical protein
MSYCRHIAGVGTIALVLALTGCGQQDSAEKPGTTAASQPNAATPVTTTTHSFAPAPAGGHGVPVSAAQQALQTAAQAVPNGRPFDLEVETDSGTECSTSRSRRTATKSRSLSMRMGGRSSGRTRPVPPTTMSRKSMPPRSKPVGQSERPLKHQPNVTVSEMEIDTNRDGVVVWQVELVRVDGSEVEIDVDAHRGAITRTS